MEWQIQKHMVTIPFAFLSRRTCQVKRMWGMTFKQSEHFWKPNKLLRVFVPNFIKREKKVLSCCKKFKFKSWQKRKQRIYCRHSRQKNAKRNNSESELMDQNGVTIIFRYRKTVWWTQLERKHQLDVDTKDKWDRVVSTWALTSCN